MANKRIDMSKLKYILRLFFQGRNKLQISQNGGVSRNTLKSYLKILESLQLSAQDIEELSDKELEELFIKPSIKPLNIKAEALHELFIQNEKRMKKTGMTRSILWEEYIKADPTGYQKTQFNEYFNKWLMQQRPSMRIEHKAGDKMYVDFTGDKLKYIDKQSGEVIYVEVFVSILGASQLAYVEAVGSQQKEDFVSACESALHYYEGVPAALVPDNLKSAVKKSSKYEPTINETFSEFAEHYGFTVLPTRAYKPKDKAHVENMVKITYSQIFTRIQELELYSLEEINKEIRTALEDLNNKNFKGRDYSRRMQFEEIERKELRPLPALKFEFKKHLFKTIAKNGHVLLSEDHHSYSVPYQYIGKKVKIQYSRQTVEIYYNYERIAIHNRSKAAYHYTTEKDHMASSHKFVSDWNPERFMKWGHAIHEDVGIFIERILQNKSHPEQAYKSCVGVLSFEKKYNKERLIKACQRALSYGICNYKIIQTILEKKLDEFNEVDTKLLFMPEHENIRGSEYYKKIIS